MSVFYSCQDTWFTHKVKQNKGRCTLVHFCNLQTTTITFLGVLGAFKWKALILWPVAVLRTPRGGSGSDWGLAPLPRPHSSAVQWSAFRLRVTCTAGLRMWTEEGVPLLNEAAWTLGVFLIYLQIMCTILVTWSSFFRKSLCVGDRNTCRHLVDSCGEVCISPPASHLGVPCTGHTDLVSVHQLPLPVTKTFLRLLSWVLPISLLNSLFYSVHHQNTDIESFRLCLCAQKEWWVQISLILMSFSHWFVLEIKLSPLWEPLSFTGEFNYFKGHSLMLLYDFCFCPSFPNYKYKWFTPWKAFLHIVLFSGAFSFHGYRLYRDSFSYTFVYVSVRVKGYTHLSLFIRIWQIPVISLHQYWVEYFYCFCSVLSCLLVPFAHF